MHRSILTGTIVFAFSAAGFGIARADQVPVPPAAAAVSASLNDGQSSAATLPDPAPAEAAPAAALPQTDTNPAAPMAGADTAMWNPASAARGSEPVAGPAKPISRLRRFASGIVNRSSAIASSLTRSAMRFIGTPFVFGGTRATGFDCSGYVQHVFALLGMHLPRTADAQYDAGRHIAAAIQPGDLVFFHTYAPGVSHVGIYLGHDTFIHSSSSHGVAITSLHNSYWAPRYLGAKRIFGS